MLINFVSVAVVSCKHVASCLWKRFDLESDELHGKRSLSNDDLTLFESTNAIPL